jgi:hypothetical protein
VPYNRKADEPGGFTTNGFADVSVFGQLGFKYDEGFQLVPETESLDDLEDWHMTAFFGLTFPTGDPNLRDADGNIDPGKSTGFGETSWSLGFAATKMLSGRWTFNQEISTIIFNEHSYDDGARVRFGTELRSTTAASFRLRTDQDRRSRIDLSIEAQYLSLGRDRSNGRDERATGGDILYLVPGIRAYRRNYSLGVGLKVPVWTDLNEEPMQQGGEGTEDYRLIVTVSALFGNS